MRLPMLLLSLSITAGCASQSAWTVHDRHGWPVQTWGARHRAQLGAVQGTPQCESRLIDRQSYRDQRAEVSGCVGTTNVRLRRR